MLTCSRCGLQWPPDLGHDCPWCTPGRRPPVLAWGCLLAVLTGFGLAVAGCVALQRQHEPTQTFRYEPPLIVPGR